MKVRIEYNDHDVQKAINAGLRVCNLYEVALVDKMAVEKFMLGALRELYRAEVKGPTK